MKKNRLSLFTALIVVVMVVSMLMLSCTPSTGTPSPSTSSQPAPQAKTLKIGEIAWMGFPLGLDMVHGLEIMSAEDNKNGGWSIGGEKYKIELIAYDSNLNQATAQANANKLVFEDKVKFILGDPILVDSYLPTTEQNKVILVAVPDSPTIMSSKNKYSFLGGYMNCGPVVFTGWFAKNYPNIKTVGAAYPDNQQGHNYAPYIEKVFGTFGIKVMAEFYPAESQDLSALGTKIKSLNPNAFLALSGGPVQDALAYKAVWQAGYRGQLYSCSTQPAAQLASVIPVEALEGFINGAWPVEFDPAETDLAKRFKELYIAKYGKWDGPEITCTSTYYCLKAALQQAGTLDADKVASVIGSGLKFEGPTGQSVMVARPDIGNDRTVDCVVGYYVKKIVNGKPVKIGVIGLDEAIGYAKLIYK